MEPVFCGRFGYFAFPRGISGFRVSFVDYWVPVPNCSSSQKAWKTPRRCYNAQQHVDICHLVGPKFRLRGFRCYAKAIVEGLKRSLSEWSIFETHHIRNPGQYIISNKELDAAGHCNLAWNRVTSVSRGTS